MAHGMSEAHYIEGMRLSERERMLLIEQLKKIGVAERRRHARLVVEGGIALLCTMDFPGGSSAHFRIYPWDISKSGIGFFHRAYIYPGTKCTFTGKTFDHQPFSIKGDVMMCAHVSGSVHTVGVKLEFEIEPEMLLGESAAASAPSPGASPADVSPDWWMRLALQSDELSKLAREKASEDVIRKKVATISEHASAGPQAAQSAPAAKAA